MTTSTKLILLIALAVLSFVSVAGAHPYASGVAVVNNAGATNVQFILNENASNVTVTLYNGGGSFSTNLGALNKGQNSFALGTNTSYAISVFNTGTGTPFQTTTTASNTTSYYAPRGVAVNKNPASTNFGRVYVANSATGDYTGNAPAGGTRTTTIGLYAINADQSDAFGYGAAGQVPSPMVLGGSSTYSPSKMFVGPDDMLYVADGDGTAIGGTTGYGMWMVNPTLTSATKLFNQVTGSSGTSNELGGVEATPYVTGSYAQSNLVIQAMPWDAYAGQVVLQYNIGHTALPYTGAFTTNVSDLTAETASLLCDLAVGKNGYYYLQEEFTGAGSATHPAVEVVANGVVLWNSYNTTEGSNAGTDAYNFGYGIAVSPDQQWMATLNINEQIQVTPLTNGVPNYSSATPGCPPHLGYVLTNTAPLGTARAITFDAADNIYACSGANPPSRLNVLSLNLTTTCVTSNDWTGTNGSFILITPSSPPVITAQPQSLSVVPGSNATFTVSALGGSPLSYQWQLGGTNLANGAQITGSQSNILTITSAQATNAGNYAVIVANSYGAVTSAVAVLAVSNRTAVLTWTNPVAITYGVALGANQLNASDTVPGTFTYNPTNGTVLNVGTNPLSVIFVPADMVDFNTVTGNVSLVVLPATLMVTAANASRDFGQTNPVFAGTIAGVANGDNITATYACSAVSNSPTGTYPIVPSLVDPNDRETNYTVNLVNGTLTVAPAGTVLLTWGNPAAITYGSALGSNQLDAIASVPGTFAYSPTNGAVLNAGTNTLSVIFTPTDTVDYNDATGNVSLVVLPAPLFVTAANANRPYGQVNPIFTGAIVGVTNGDNISAAYNCSAATNSAPGPYAIVPSLVDPNNRQTNYTVSLTNGTLTVTTAAPVLTWAAPAPITYGAALGSNQLNATASVPGAFVYSPVSGTYLNAGTAALSVIFTPSNTVDYVNTTGSVNLVVSPAPLTATAANASRPYGQNNPVFTGSITGVTNGDNITANFSCGATINSPAGTYPIVPSLSDPNNRQTNYSVSLVNGTLTITPGGTTGNATPTIIPLPEQMQVFVGTFTLCPSQPVPGAPALAPIKILTDAASQGTGQYLAARLFQSTGFRFQLGTNTGGAVVKNAIVLTTVNANTNLGAEGYELTVAPDSVFVRAPAQAGVFYGVQSLLQLLPPQVLSHVPVSGVSWTAPCVYIYDLPRFPWRGWMLDVARHFLNKDDVKAFIDIMALHKLNTLHWHLVDDQGWRVQIMAYPLLTQTGAWRSTMDYGLNPLAATNCYNAAGQYGGYYTQNDIREVVAYAQERHINIVPEIEMPAHTTSALASYPQFGCGDPVGDYDMDSINYNYDLYSLAGTNNTAPGTNTYAFLEEVLTELMGLFPSQYIHCGGDEVVATGDHQWTTYTPDVAEMAALGITGSTTAKITAYQHWFSTNIAAFLRSNGRTMVGWTEFEAGGTVTNAVLMDWEYGSSSAAVATAEAGQYVVMAPETNCYMNYYMTSNTTVEPFFEVGSGPAYLLLNAVYNFEPIPAGLPSQYNSFILGAEGTEFAEFIPGLRNAEFKALPRMCAMAEVTWTQAALKNYTNFTQRLVTHEQRLAQMGANYDQTNTVQIGAWTQPISSSGTTVNYDITPYVTAAGEIDVDFNWTSGADAILVYSVALLENGVQIDLETFTSFAGNYSGEGIPTTGLPVYLLHLTNFKPGATYSVQAFIAGDGGTASNGTVYLTNWN